MDSELKKRVTKDEKVREQIAQKFYGRIKAGTSDFKTLKKNLCGSTVERTVFDRNQAWIQDRHDWIQGKRQPQENDFPPPQCGGSAIVFVRKDHKGNFRTPNQADCIPWMTTDECRKGQFPTANSKTDEWLKRQTATMKKERGNGEDVGKIDFDDEVRMFALCEYISTWLFSPSLPSL